MYGGQRQYIFSHVRIGPYTIVQPSRHGADDSEQGWRRQRSATHERAVLLPASLGRSLRRVMIHRRKTG